MPPLEHHRHGRQVALALVIDAIAGEVQPRQRLGIVVCEGPLEAFIYLFFPLPKRMVVWQPQRLCMGALECHEDGGATV